MIKPEDLKIGNLVFDADCDIPREILEIREGFVLFKDRNGCLLQSLSGINISEKYLIDNGYQLEFDNNEGVKFYENQHLSLCLKNGWVTVFIKTMRITKYKDYYLGNIQFIHQLQNLYFALQVNN